MLNPFRRTHWFWPKVSTDSKNPSSVPMCGRAGPGLCPGPVSPGAPGPGPGYHNSQPSQLWQNENCLGNSDSTTVAAGTKSVRLFTVKVSGCSKLRVKIRSVLLLCKKVLFWTARPGRIPSFVIIFTFVILIQDLRLTWILFFEKVNWVESDHFDDGLIIVVFLFIYLFLYNQL